MSNIVCILCGKEFSDNKCKDRKYCSRRCSGLSQRTRIATQCLYCGKDMIVEPNRVKVGKGKYCGKICQSLSYRQNRGDSNKNWKGGLIDRECLYCGKHYLIKPCTTNRSKYCSRSCHNKSKRKDGIIKSLLRNGFLYKEWRISVFKRDLYVCQHCGSKRKLNAHHIISFASDPSLRYDITNGITLCSVCHRKEHRKTCHSTMHVCCWEMAKLRGFHTLTVARCISAWLVLSMCGFTVLTINQIAD